MKLIFAQGNPSREHAGTRHNVGFMVLDKLAEIHEVDFSPKPRFFADIAEILVGGEKVMLVKPVTYYNETGRSARALMDFYQLSPSDDLLVIHDDLALPFGTIRIRKKGSDAGNNGIKSLNNSIGQDYMRIRIGIYNDLRDKIDDADFVLSRFTREEQKTIEDTVLLKVSDLVKTFLDGNLEDTSHTLT